MSITVDVLPWSSLSLSQPQIPWADLQTLADAAAESPEVRRRLMDEFHALVDRRRRADPSGYADMSDLSVLAVFALGADHFDDAARTEVAEFMVQMLESAGDADEDFLLEVGHIAAGRLGPAIVEPALRLLKSTGPEVECWSHLAPLLSAAEDAGEELRKSVIRFCRRVVCNILDGSVAPYHLEPAIWVLENLNDTGSLPMLRQLRQLIRNADLDETIEQLEGRGRPLDPRIVRPWLEPVEEWLPRCVERVRQWLAENEENAQTEDGSQSDHEDEERARQAEDQKLVDAFVESEAFAALPDEVKDDAPFAVHCFLGDLADYGGVSVVDMGPADAHTVLVELFPRNISEVKEFFVHAPDALTAFFAWLGGTGRIANAPELIETVRQSADKMLWRSQDPTCWGMAKTFVMTAKAVGVDPSDKDAMDRFALLYNFLLAERRHQEATQSRRANRQEEWAPRAIIRGEFKIGRNDPCTCGSGRKYKKCCGRQ